MLQIPLHRQTAIMTYKSSNLELKLAENNDQQSSPSITTTTDVENSPNVVKNAGDAVNSPPEFNLTSSLQILGAFMLLFNSYVFSHCSFFLTFKMGILELVWSISELL